MHSVLAFDGQADNAGYLLLLAQPETGGVESAGAGNGTPEAGGAEETPEFSILPMILVFGAVILFMMMIGGNSQKKQQRKQQEKQNELIASLSKGDKIVTIGGIKGAVAEVRENDVIVKVDENNNTRMKFSREAIREVTSDKAEVEEK